MPSYFITGTSRGIGFELLRQLSEDPNNTVIGLVRDKTATEEKISKEIGKRENIFIVKGDVLDTKSLKDAEIETRKITGGRLDYLIGNAGYMPKLSRFNSLGYLSAKDEQGLEDDLLKTFQINCLGNIQLFNIFLPLIKNGDEKKVVTISTGMSDMALAAKYHIYQGAPYSISKAAVNMAIAKFHAEYQKEGIIFMGVCPGSVDTQRHDDLKPEEMAPAGDLGKSFIEYAPDFKGPVGVEEGVRDVLKVIHDATMEGNGGRTVSHFGNDRWL